MRFAYPQYLHILWLIPLFGLVFWRAAAARRRSLQAFGEEHLIVKLSRNVSRRRQTIKIILRLLALLCLGFAAARPQFATHAVPVKAEGIDLVFALDTSLSMLAEDIKPNRLDRAKHEISGLMDKLHGDRVGIVIFSGVSFIQCPLTFDYDAVRLFLDNVNTNSISVPGTALEIAIRASIRAFEHSPAESAKVIVVLTDGESHEDDPIKAAEEAEKAGMKIYTIGIGSEKGELIPLRDEQGTLNGYKKDRDGNVVMTKLDQLTLEKIAMLANGKFYHVSSGGIELEKIYDDIAQMEKTERETQLVMQYDEQYQYFIGAALLFLLIDILLGERRKIKTAWEGRFQ